MTTRTHLRASPSQRATIRALAMTRLRTPPLPISTPAFSAKPSPRGDPASFFQCHVSVLCTARAVLLHAVAQRLEVFLYILKVRKVDPRCAKRLGKIIGKKKER